MVQYCVIMSLCGWCLWCAILGTTLNWWNSHQRPKTMKTYYELIVVRFCLNHESPVQKTIQIWIDPNQRFLVLKSSICKMFQPGELWIFGQGICPKSTVFKKLFGWNGMKSFNARIEWIHSNNQVCKYWNIIICMMNLTSV